MPVSYYQSLQPTWTNLSEHLRFADPSGSNIYKPSPLLERSFRKEPSGCPTILEFFSDGV